MAAPMDALIEKMNRLQDLCALALDGCALDLPQIVVIGSQSSGKTSVLEGVVGRDFLPRGSGITTRRPLVLQLIAARDADPEFCTFNHAPERRFVDFGDVKREILEETGRLLRGKNDVSHVPITMKLHSARVLPLTLVDLPGLVKVPLGDQPRNICARIEEMCRKFAANPNAIILAVSAANTDIANSDALELARAVDPDYERTIGVLTKLDIMDAGTDVAEVLGRRKVDLRLGFVPVVNRSQADVVRGKGVEAALADERRFFETHPAYRRNRLVCGTQFLVEKLHGILQQHIRACLPTLQHRVERLLAETRADLRSTGTQGLAPREFVFKTLSDVSRRFSDVLQGRSELSATALCGGARLGYALHHQFAAFALGLDALSDVGDAQVRTLLLNSSGSASTVVFAHAAFEKLARQSVEKLRPHALRLVSVIFNEVVKMLHGILADLHVLRFPALHARIVACAVALFKHRSEAAHRLVDAFVEWNVAYINTRNPDFDRHGTPGRSIAGDSDAQRACAAPKAGEITFDPIPHVITRDMTDSETAEVEAIKSLVRSYFGVVRAVVVDQVPKAIMTELVIKSERELQAALFRDVHEAEGVEEAVRESEEAVERRRALEQSADLLQQAHDTICSI